MSELPEGTLLLGEARRRFRRARLHRIVGPAGEQRDRRVRVECAKLFDADSLELRRGPLPRIDPLTPTRDLLGRPRPKRRRVRRHGPV